MALCLNNYSGIYEYCTSHLSAYIAIGIIIPLGILLIIALSYFYLRYRQRRLRRAPDQTYMTTIIPVYHNEEGQQVPYNYSYPPHYTPGSDEVFGKPPSYEQTVQQVSETNHQNNLVGDSAAILPVTSMSSSEGHYQDSTKNQS